MPASAPRSSTSSADISATGPAKLQEVTRLLDILTKDLDEISLLPHQRDAHLDSLKILGRDPVNAEPLFTKQAMETLTRHGFNSPSHTTSRNALRCICNIMVHRPETRQMFVDLGYEAKACNKLKNDNRDDEFLVSRVLFLTTYGTDIDIEKLIDQYHVAETISQNLSRHTKQYVTKSKKIKEIDPMEDMALDESLKLLFNLTHHCPQRASQFSPALHPILTIIVKRPIPANKPVDPPVRSLLHTLLNLELDDPHNISTMFPKSDQNLNISRILDILEMAVKAYTGENLEREVPPLLALLRRLYELSPKDVQSYTQSRALPSEEDRKEVLGRADTLSGRLLKLSTDPLAPSVRESCSALLFELSNQDAQTFVQNVGYGFAAGFLMNKDIAVPQNAMEAYSTNTSGEAASQARQIPVNPITGQRLDSEAKIDMPEMSEDEKEREAERLFVLFERLKQTGVMNVQNPVQKAYQEGRFLELDDDADSD
ncbi:Synembryn-like protein C3E7.04c [Phlyctema vagabunda]|uniref:Synembryn-like protein C3E7.04c n=1 Tax=Phlyctema vagabunda TaxID=108571 RepID=A0ABR4PQM7_9HELO